MKQKYFVLIFLNILLMSSVFSQGFYSNIGDLKIEPGTDFTIVDVGHEFVNSSLGDIQNEGTITISSGDFRNEADCLNEGTGIINFGGVLNNSTITNDGVINSSGTFANAASGIYTNNGSLFLERNYYNNGTINPSTGTTTFNQRDSAPAEIIQEIGGGPFFGTFEFYNLVVNNNTSLGVLVVGPFTELKVTNELYLQEGNLRLQAESQLIQPTGSSVNYSGTGALLRDQQGVGSRYGYNYWSSPVNDGAGTTYSLANVLHDGTDSSVNPFSPTPIQFTPTTDVVGGSNGSPSVVDGSGNVTTAATIGARYLYKFINGPVNDDNSWVRISQTEALDTGIGYTMKGTGDVSATNQNYTFKGQPNNGNISHTFSGGNSTLVGNPYPSAYDIDALITKTSWMTAAYFWVDGGSDSHTLAEYLGGYATRTGGGGVPASTIPGPGGVGDADAAGAPGQYLAVGQGFFAETYLPFFPVTVNFINEDRAFVIEDGTNSIFFKDPKKENEIAQKEDLSKRSNIRIGYEDPEGFHRQLLLSFIPGSSADLDFNEGYDAPVSGPREDDLFFIIENDPSMQYVIQGVGAYNEDVVLPLSLAIAEEGVHTIMLDAVENFDGSVYVYDKVLDITYDISDASFTPNLPIGQYNDRFEVVFKQQSSLGTDDEIISNFNVYFDGDQNLVVRNKNNLDVSKLSVFNTLGQQLLLVNNNELEQSQTLIPFNYQMGVYIIVVETNEGKETFRIINK